MGRILIIEPDQITGRMLSEFLHAAGHDVTCASGAQQAIQIADNNMPDIIILEILLADHNGIEFLYELRSYPDWQPIPVIVYSRVPAEELKISKKISEDLNIYKVLYKTETNLQQLAEAIDNSLIKSGQ